jgi:hypothetical protein
LDVLLTVPRSFRTCSVTRWEPGDVYVCCTECPDAWPSGSPSKSHSSLTIGLWRDDVDVKLTSCPTAGLAGL